jgi:hypothetical protein
MVFCEYRISANSFRGNYSFLKVGVRQLFKGGNYSREETIDFLLFRGGNYSREESIQGQKLYEET